jgi:hypothetical protein
MKGVHPFIKDQLKKLTLASTLRKSKYLNYYHHFYPETGRIRQRRISARKKVVAILSILVSEIDLETFAWGKWFTRNDNTTDFYTRGIKYLMKKTGFAERTVCRILADLEACGYLKSARNRAIGKDGQLVKLYSLRVLTDRFFIDLGVKKSTLENLRHYKREENAAKFNVNPVSSLCKQTLSKLGRIFKETGKKNKKKDHNPSANKYSNTTNTPSPSSNKRKYSKAAYWAEKLNLSPLTILRDHQNLLT